MAYGLINADQIGTSVANTSLGAGDASLMKNRIINGAMVIDQRNNGSSVTPTSNIYTLDRWQTIIGGVASKFSVQQNAGSVTPPVGFTKYLGMTSLSAYSVGSTDRFAINQNIEGLNATDLAWGTANAKTITISAWVYSSLTGSFGGSIQNGGGNRSYPFSYTISSANTWTQISVTIPGDTTGTWATDNTAWCQLYFSLGAGATYSGTANTWAAADYRQPTGSVSVVGTNGATLYITGVQLEVGSIATGFEYRQYGQELNLCQRYLYTAGGAFNGNVSFNQYGLVVGNTSTSGRVVVSLPVTMRSAPSFSVVGVTNIYANYAGSSALLTSATIDVGSPTSCSLTLNYPAIGGGTQGGNWYQNSNNSSQILFSAEL